MARVFFAVILLALLLQSVSAGAQDKTAKKHVKTALASLRSTQSKIRCQGLKQIAELSRSDPEIIKALEVALKDPSEEVRVSLAQTLTSLVESRSVHSLITRLCGDESAAVRSAVSPALASLPTSAEKEVAFLELLSDQRSLVLIRVLHDLKSEASFSLPMLERILKLSGHSHPMVRRQITRALLKTSENQFKSLFQSFDRRSRREQDLLRRSLFHSGVSAPWVFEYIVSLLKKAPFKDAVKARLKEAGVAAFPALVQEYKRTKREEDREELDEFFNSILENESDEGLTEKMIKPLVYTMVFGHEDFALSAADLLSYDSELAGKVIEEAFQLISKREDDIVLGKLMECLENVLADKSLPVLLKWAGKKKCLVALMASKLLDYFQFEWYPSQELIRWGVQSKKNIARELSLNLLFAEAHGEYFVLEILKEFIQSKNQRLKSKAFFKLSDLSRSFRPAERFLRAAAFSKDPDVAALGLRHLPKRLGVDDSFMGLILRQIRQINGENGDVALEHLSSLRNTPAKWTKDLEALATSENIAQRCAALRALSRQKPIAPSSRRILINSLFETDSTVRTTASQCLQTVSLTRAESKALIKKARQLDKDGEIDIVKDVISVFRKTHVADDLLVPFLKKLVIDKEHQSSIDRLLALKHPLDKRYIEVLVMLLQESFITGQTANSLARIGPDCLEPLNEIYDDCSEGAKALILATVSKLNWSNEATVTLIKKGLRGTSLIKIVAWECVKKHYDSSEAYGQLLRIAIERSFSARPEIVKHVRPEQRIVFDSLFARYKKDVESRGVIEALSYCQTDRSAIAKELLKRLSESPGPSVLRCFERIDASVVKDLLALTLDDTSTKQWGALTVLAHSLRMGAVPSKHGELDQYGSDLIQSIKRTKKTGLKTKKVLVFSYLKESSRFDQSFYETSLTALSEKERRSILIHRPTAQFSELEEELFCRMTERYFDVGSFEEFCHAYAGTKRLSPRVRRTLEKFSGHRVKSVRVLAFQVLTQFREGVPVDAVTSDSLLRRLLDESDPQFIEIFVDTIRSVNWLSKKTFERLAQSPAYLKQLQSETLSVLLESNLEFSDADLRGYLAQGSRKVKLVAASALRDRGCTLENNSDAIKAIFASDYFEDRRCAVTLIPHTGKDMNGYRQLVLSFLADCTPYDEYYVLETVSKLAPLTDEEWNNIAPGPRKRLKEHLSSLTLPLEDIDSLTILKSYLKHPDLNVQKRAVYHMAAVAPRRHSMVVALAKTFPRADSSVQKAIVSVFSRLSHPRRELITVFEHCLNSSDPDLRRDAYNQLLRLGKEDLPFSAFENAFQTNPSYSIPLVFNGPHKSKKFNERIVALLRNRLKRSYGPGRERLAISLLTVAKDVSKELDFILSAKLHPLYNGQYPTVPEKSLSLLCSLVNSKSISTLKKRRGLEVLSRIEPKALAPVISKLIPVLLGKDKGLAGQVESLFRLQNSHKDLAGALLNQYQQSDDAAKLKILELVGWVGHGCTSLIPALLKLKIPENSALERELLKCLGSLGYQGSYRESQLLRYASAPQRSDASFILNALGQRLGRSIEGQKLFENYLSSENSRYRKLALKSLSRKTLSPKILSKVLDLIDSAKAEELEIITATLISIKPFPESALIQRLESGTLESKRTLLKILASSQSLGRPSQDALGHYLKDEHSSIREAAMSAMQAIDVAGPELRQLVRNHYQKASTVERELALKTLCSAGFVRDRGTFIFCLDVLAKRRLTAIDLVFEALVCAARKDTLVFERFLFHPHRIAGRIAVFSRYGVPDTQGLRELKKALQSQSTDAQRRALRVLLALKAPNPSLKSFIEKIAVGSTDKELKGLCEDYLQLFKKSD